MSKRAGYFQMKQPFASKKPKLDIEIIPSQQYNPPAASTSKTSRVSKVVSKNTPENDNDALWGDDDDEIIVLATQAAEAFEADTTFGRFSHSVKSSTQITVAAHGPHSGPKRLASDKLVAELLADDEDDIFSEKLDDNYKNYGSEINEYFNNDFDEDYNLNEFRQQEPPPEVEFKVPAPTVKVNTNEILPPLVKEEKNSPRIKSTFGPKFSTTTSPEAFPPALQRYEPSEATKENLTQKQERAKDIQVKFLTSHVETLGKKVEILQKDCNEALEKAQVKDGEVSMLRYELKMVKSTNEQLRLEKIREKETIRKEWVEKLRDLEKVVMSQKADLEFKEMELMNLKTRRMNNSMRSSVEPRETPKKLCTAVKPKPVEKETNLILSDLLPRLSLVSEPPEIIEKFQIDPKVFKLSHECLAQDNRRLRKFSRLSRNESVVADQLISLQTCLSEVKYAVHESDKDFSLKVPLAKVPDVIEATRKGLDEITQYCQRLVQQTVEVQPCIAGRTMERGSKGRPKSKLEVSHPINVFQPDKLFVGEQALILRRFLALVGLFCRISTDLMVDSMLKNGLILRLAQDVRRVSRANILFSLHGMVTGAAALLNGMSFRQRRLRTFGTNGSQLMELFRSVVLCHCDAPSTLTEMSAFLRRLSVQATEECVLGMLNRLCFTHNQPADSTGQTKPRKQLRLKTISFSQETCTLQMYAVLLEGSVRQHVPYDDWQLKPLLANTENTIHFLRNVLLPPVGWVNSFLDKSDPNGCDLCHIRMVSAFVVLLHRTLLCWEQRTVREEEDIRRLSRIAQSAVLLMYDLFQLAYRKKLLRLAGHSIAYRLRVSYNWLKMYEKQFNFEHIHSTTLRMLDMRLLMSDPHLSTLEMDGEEMEPGGSKSNCKRIDKPIMEELFSDFVKDRFPTPGGQ